jgi:hypothetical protein
MKMGKLMTRSCIVHKCFFLYFICQFINNVTLIWKYTSNVILLFLTTNKENLILTLDGSEFLGQNFSVSDWNSDCCLSI